MRMHGVAPREHAPGEEHDVADLQSPCVFCGERRAERHLAARSREAGLIEHRDDWRRRIAIQPALDQAGRSVEHHPETPERPAVVRDRHEEAGRQPVERADLAADERNLAAEAHGADSQVVGGAHDGRLELRQPGIGIEVIQRPEQLLFRVGVA